MHTDRQRDMDTGHPWYKNANFIVLRGSLYRALGTAQLVGSFNRRPTRNYSPVQSRRKQVVYKKFGSGDPQPPTENHSFPTDVLVPWFLESFCLLHLHVLCDLPPCFVNLTYRGFVVYASVGGWAPHDQLFFEIWWTLVFCNGIACFKEKLLWWEVSATLEWIFKKKI